MSSTTSKWLVGGGVTIGFVAIVAVIAKLAAARRPMTTLPSGSNLPEVRPTRHNREMAVTVDGGVLVANRSAGSV